MSNEEFHQRFTRPDVVVALVAHDGKKQELLDLARSHREILTAFRLVATRSTGSMISRELGLPVELVDSGPRGGDLQIGSRIVEQRIDAVVFLRDPLAAHPHEPDIQALLKVCDVHSIPLATNSATAEILLHFLWERSTARLAPTTED